MFKEAKRNPDKAEVMFDDITAQGFRQVMALELSGNYEQAQQLQQQVEANAPAPAYCGAGSCGLEGTSLASSDGLKAQSLGLKATNKNELLHDTQRPCPECKEKKVFYDMKGNKACTSCEFVLINGQFKEGKKKAEKHAA
jgi:hypothetical protein